MPPLLKLWCDEILRRDFAFGPDGSHFQGKDLLISITTGGLGDQTFYSRVVFALSTYCEGLWIELVRTSIYASDRACDQ
jgi:putative NADPH-quinone reductase